MSDPIREPNPAQPRGGPTLSMRMRFNPRVLILVVAALLAWPAVVGLVVAGIHTIWSASFAQVDYVMVEARENAGYPYITGKLGATGIEHLVSARKRGDGYLVGDAGDDPFVPGKVIKVWWSPSAPDLLIQGQRTNGVPVSALPERPGLLALLGYAAWLLAVIVIAYVLMKRVPARIQRASEVTLA